MRADRDKCETHHLMCMVCGALPGVSCIDGDQERSQVHPSRRMSIAERNWRSRQGWEPPELAERRREQRARQVARAPLFDPRLGPGVAAAVRTSATSRRPVT
jgi:hypothetical protein